MSNQDTREVDALTNYYLSLMTKALPRDLKDVRHALALIQACITSAAAIEHAFDIEDEWIATCLDGAREAIAAYEEDSIEPEELN